MLLGVGEVQENSVGLPPPPMVTVLTPEEEAKKAAADAASREAIKRRYEAYIASQPKTPYENNWRGCEGPLSVLALGAAGLYFLPGNWKWLVPIAGVPLLLMYGLGSAFGGWSCDFRMLVSPSSEDKKPYPPSRVIPTSIL